ncbi:YfhO family protein [Lactiplantibacillus sp. WILCCON 0030]|uniref:YfhO family protein n=1 Tax=Lactiplantibacillus brownii TaxID=3069269 RepID=A0ABU1A7Q6_9LACO|nr:YfhO family protein [Lactiplantibacillus brownii]MDQ7936959.1 YfhO family protein [Lactiplantibacillus brownii]
MTSNRRLDKKIIYLFGLVFPMTVFLVVLALKGVHPFGSTALFSNDMDEQYIAFFSYYRRVLLSSPSQFLYSFSNGLGGNMIGIWAYYLLSPFNLILLFFPTNATATAVVVLTTLKIGFAGLSMTILLVHKNRKVNRLLVLLLSNSYALMSYVINYNSNIMWMDAVVLLPLVILGVERIIDRNKGVLYSVTLALVIITNYYTAYMTAIFVCIYFIWYLSLKKNVTFKIFASKGWLFVRNSMIAGIISAVIEMPNLYVLSQSKIQNQTSWSGNFLYNPLLLLVKTIGYYYDDTLPIIFVGSFALTLFVLYFFNQNISKKERAKTGLISLVLWLSACYDPTVIMWHAFQRPIGYRYQFMFVIGFWIIVIAFRSIENLTRVSFKSLVGLIEFFVLIVIFAIMVRKQFTLLNNAALFGTLLTEIIVVFLLYYLHRNKPLIVFGLIVVVSFQLGANAYFSYNGIALANNTKIDAYYNDLNLALKRIPKDTLKNSRVEKTFLRDSDKLNDSFQMGYNGGSVYSSTLQQSVAKFYRIIGQPSRPDNMNYFLSYTNGTVPMDTLLGFSYIFGQTRHDKKSPIMNNIESRYDLKTYKKLSEKKNVGIFKTDALPIAFVSNGNVGDVKLRNNTAIYNQQKIINGVFDNKTTYFKQLKVKVVKSQNVEKEELKRGQIIRKSGNGKSWVELSVNTSLSKLVYAEVRNQLLAKAKLTTDAGKVLSFHTLINNPIVLSIPNGGKDTIIRMEVEQDNLSLSDLRLFEFNGLRYKKDLKKVHAENQNNNIQVAGNKVSGTLKADQNNESIILSIPFEKGWQMHIDGEQVKYSKVFGTFMAVKVKKGTHHLEMNYVPPYLALGFIMSIIGILLLVFEFFYERKRQDFWRGN